MAWLLLVAVYAMCSCPARSRCCYTVVYGEAGELNRRLLRQYVDSEQPGHSGRTYVIGYDMYICSGGLVAGKGLLTSSAQRRHPRPSPDSPAGPSERDLFRPVIAVFGSDCTCMSHCYKVAECSTKPTRGHAAPRPPFHAPVQAPFANG